MPAGTEMSEAADAPPDEGAESSGAELRRFSQHEPEPEPEPDPSEPELAPTNPEPEPAPPNPVVIAPPGRLGVVFKGDETGPGHSVHKVRDSSDLAGQLLPGDMVVSVNEIDTSTYDHDQMAALLSSQGNQERKLVVMRPAASA